MYLIASLASLYSSTLTFTHWTSESGLRPDSESTDSLRPFLPNTPLLADKEMLASTAMGSSSTRPGGEKLGVWTRFKGKLTGRDEYSTANDEALEAFFRGLPAPDDPAPSRPVRPTNRPNPVASNPPFDTGVNFKISDRRAREKIPQKFLAQGEYSKAQAKKSHADEQISRNNVLVASGSNSGPGPGEGRPRAWSWKVGDDAAFMIMPLHRRGGAGRNDASRRSGGEGGNAPRNQASTTQAATEPSEVAAPSTSARSRPVGEHVRASSEPWVLPAQQPQMPESLMVRHANTSTSTVASRMTARDELFLTEASRSVSAPDYGGTDYEDEFEDVALNESETAVDGDAIKEDEKQCKNDRQDPVGDVLQTFCLRKVM